MEDHVPEYKAKYNAHVIRIVVILLAAAVVGIIARKMFIPGSFGEYGHYRGGAIQDEMNRPLKHGTNESCLSCHAHIKEMHLGGVHRTVSCEFCHGPYADHVKDGVKYAALPVKKGEEIKTLCLRCHNQIIRARPKESIKMIEMPKHLQEKNVRLDHACDQCHNVHAPLMWVKQAREMSGVAEPASAAPCQEEAL